MLVLTRKQNDKIQIGDNITVTVLRMKGKAVRLGIEAPSSVNVMRGELVFELSDQDEQPVKSPSSTGVQQPTKSKVARRDIEAIQSANDRWPVENSNPTCNSSNLQYLTTAPMATIAAARSH